MRNVTILLTVVAMLAVAAQAAPTIYEPIDYAAGGNMAGLASASRIGLGNWSTYYESTQIPVVAGCLAYPTGSPLVGVANKAAPAKSWSNYRHRATVDTAAQRSMADDSTFYMSGLFSFSDTHDYHPRMLIGLTTSTQGNSDPNLRFGFRWGTAYQNPATYSFVLSGPGGDEVLGNVASANVTYLLAVKVVTVASGNDQAFMKVYAVGTDTVGAEPVAWDITTAGAASDDLLSHAMIAGSQTAGQFDEWRVGDTWEDVTGVPEPATMILLGIGGIGVLIRRKRK